MIKGLQHLHNVSRWIVLGLALYVLIRYVMGLVQNRPFERSEQLAGLFYLIAMDSQLVLGLVLYFGKGWLNNINMAIPSIRFWSVEHLTGMLVAILLVHLGYRRVKVQQMDAAKYKAGLIFFGLSLVIMLVMIPWPFRAEGIARGLMPGMAH